MAAAIAQESVATTIYYTLQHHAKVFSNTGVIKPAKYMLRFTFDDKEFSTIFELKEDEHLTNGCISLSGFDSFDSSISSNSPARNCFTPNLSNRENLPAGVTQTDILQVLSTKLKFAALPSRKFLAIVDVASLINPETNKKYVTQLSHWRLLRGERTLYEKYGYTNLLLDKVREISQTTRWEEIKYQTIKGKSLTEIAESFFTSEGTAIFVSDRTISDCMKHVSYNDSDKIIIPNIIPALPSHTIVSMILTAFVQIGKLTQRELTYLLYLKINRQSELWKSWDSRLQFQSFYAIMEGGRRKTLRRRKNRKTRRSRTNISE